MSSLLKMKSVVIMGSLAGVFYACGETQFSSRDTANKKKQIPVKTQKLSLTCDGLNTPAVQKNITGFTNTRLVIEGELCHKAETPTNSNNLSVAFVLDFSGSMQENDPTYSGSCGRNDAVSAIIQKLKASATPGTQIEAGVVGFDDNASVIETMKPVGSGQFGFGSNYCRANGYTNYEAAFIAAGRMFAGGSGRKAVYFISDGLPTASSGEREQSDELGLSAAISLRNSSSDLTVYAIYLSDPSGQPPTSQYSDITDPRAYLAKITGSDSNVKVISSASQLATEIVKFKLPEPVESNLKLPKATLSALGFSSQEIKFSSFVAHPTQVDTWVFSTDPIELNGVIGGTVENRILIEAISDQGVSKSTEANVIFTVPNE